MNASDDTRRLGLHSETSPERSTVLEKKTMRFFRPAVSIQEELEDRFEENKKKKYAV